MFPNRLASFETNPTQETAARSRSSTPMFSEKLALAIASLPPDLIQLFHALPEQPPLAASEPDLAWSLYKLLSALDPVVAQRWHWKDTRKVFRSLCIINDTGNLPSEIIEQQSQITVQSR